MKHQSLMLILMLIWFASGCSFADEFKVASNADANVAATPKSLVINSPKPEVESNESKDSTAELGTNYLAFGAGTNVVAFTSESHSSPDTAVKLIDESGYGEDWKTDDKQISNQSVTLEFSRG